MMKVDDGTGAYCGAFGLMKNVNVCPMMSKFVLVFCTSG
jgi:hypothetical protein